MRNRQKGSALLLVLLLSAIAAAIASSLIFKVNLSIKRTTQQKLHLQRWQLAQGLEDWALLLLARDAELSPQTDSHSDLWAQPLPPTLIPGGSISGQMIDLNGRLNLNGLIAADGSDNVPAIRRFRRLIEILELPPAIVDQTLDWLDPDDQRRPLGAEAADYHGMDLQVAIANGLLSDTRELRQLPALAGEHFGRFDAHVAALRRNSRLNLNTAGLEVLMSLSDALDPTMAVQLQAKPQRPYTNVQQFLEHPLLSDYNVDNSDDVLAVRSSHFLATAWLTLSDHPQYFSALIERGGRRNDARYHIRFRQLGGVQWEADYATEATR